jgi:hypothetical protein
VYSFCSNRDLTERLKIRKGFDTDEGLMKHEIVGPAPLSESAGISTAELDKLGATVVHDKIDFNDGYAYAERSNTAYQDKSGKSVSIRPPTAPIRCAVPSRL